MLTNDQVKGILLENFPNSILAHSEEYGMLIVETNRESLRDIIIFMRDESSLKIDFLTTLCTIHYPMNKGREFAMMYQFHSMMHNFKIRFKVFMSIEDLNMPTVSDLYSSANWQERQEYDFFGINFIDHPNLKRILNVDDMDYFPMRKEHRLEDATRTDKDDSFFGR